MATAALLPILLTLGSGGGVAPPQTVPVDLRRLDALFATRALAPYRAFYLQRRAERAVKITPYENPPRDGYPARSGIVVAVGEKDPGMMHPPIQLSFFGPSGRFESFGVYGEKRRQEIGPPLDVASLEAMVARVAKDLTGDRESVGRLDVDDFGLGEWRCAAWVRRLHLGIPIQQDAAFIELNAFDGSLLSAESLTENVFVGPHADDETLAIPILRKIARERIAQDRVKGRRRPPDAPSPAYEELCLDYAPDPPGTLRRETDAPYLVPVYEYWEGAAGGYSFIHVRMDARDGRVFYFSPDGTRGALGPPDYIAGLTPTAGDLNGASGVLTPLPMRSFTPPGRPVEVKIGRFLPVSRFEPGQATLWIRREGGAYEAFGTEGALRAALKKAVRAGAKPLASGVR